MDQSFDYTKYGLDTLYGILADMKKEDNPQRVREIVKHIKYLESESSQADPAGVRKNNDNRLKYALMEQEERDVISEDPFGCFKIVSWSYRDILIGIGFIFGFYAVSKIPAIFINFGINAFTVLIIYFVIELSGISVMVTYPYYICRKRKVWPLFPAIAAAKLLKEFLCSVGWFFLLLLSTGLLIKLVELLIKLPVRTPEAWEWIKYSQLNGYLVFWLFLAVTVIPIIEEVFFRGFIYNAMKANMPTLPATLLQAAVFAMVHPYDAMNRLSIFFIGVGLAVVYERRRNLISPILVHCMINFSSILKLFLI